jgi:hypothetical protein
MSLTSRDYSVCGGLQNPNFTPSWIWRVRPVCSSESLHDIPWNGQTLIIITPFHVADRGAGQPFAAELTRKLWLESPTTLVVEVTRAGVPGGSASTTRSVYRKG